MNEAAGLTLARYREAVQACACMNFRQAARLVTAHFDEHLRPAGLRATQLNLLMAIEAADVATVTDRAEILATDRTTMTPKLKLRGGRKFVGKDRIALTGKGRRRQLCPFGKRPRPTYSKPSASVAGWPFSVSWRQRRPP